MSNFTFTSPEILFGLGLLPLFLLFFAWRGWVRASLLRRIGDPELVAALLAQVSPFRRALKSLLWLLTLIALTLALARPVWGVESEIIRSEGVQIIFAVDVSRSMDATDTAPSRLERVQLDLLGLLPQLAGNDVGMVIFAREAFPYLPLTYDMDAAAVFVDGLSTAMLTRQGTNIPAAIETSLAAFARGTSAERVIVLMSDGESFEGDTLLAAEQAAEQGVRIFAAGYGTEAGGNIPIYDASGNLIDYHTQNGNTLVLTKLDSTILRDIAAAGDGSYLPGGTITALADVINQLETGALREQVITRPLERFGWFVALALLALSLEMLLPETRREGNV